MKALAVQSAKAVVRVHDIPGPGVPLVMVHGLGCASSCDYPRVAFDDALARRRFILVDLPGSGFSDKPLMFDYSIDSLALVLVEAIELLGITECYLYGHSMGGTVAIMAAGRAPSRVKGLILSEPNLDAGGGVFSSTIAAQSEADYVAAGHAKAIRAASLSGNAVWAGSMAASSAVAVHREATSLVAGGTPSWREQLLNLAMPRTMLFGSQSLPNPDADELPRHGIFVGIVPDAGHSMMWENPSGLAVQLERAMSRP